MLAPSAKAIAPRRRGPAPAGRAGEHLQQRVGVDELAVQRIVDRRDGRLEGDGAGEVVERAGHRRDGGAADPHDVLRRQRRGVQVAGGGAPGTGGAVAGVVDAPERHAPHREPVEHGGRGVADDGVGREQRGGRRHPQRVVRGRVGQPLVVAEHVAAARDAPQLTGAAAAAQLPVGPPRRQQVGPAQHRRHVQVHTRDGDRPQARRGAVRENSRRRESGRTGGDRSCTAAHAALVVPAQP
jgi:hypothetical protein